MSIRDIFVTTLVASVLTVVLISSVVISYAQVMQSTNYRIESDSINVGGGLSTSTGYSLESTAGEVATGDSDSVSYGMRSGYQQMVSTYIAISGATDVTMTPTLGGVTGGTSNGSTTVTVTTDSLSGYQMTIEASSSPAMVSGANTIDDYVPLGAPDYTFTTIDQDAHFGYSPSGVDIVDRFRDNGAICNTGSGDTQLACWDGLDTAPEAISRRTNSNHPLGSTTTIYFRVGIGNAAVQPAGTYTATTTVTALPL